jgi:ribosomal protein S18 acetylase RimI-like enzyme
LQFYICMSQMSTFRLPSETILASLHEDDAALCNSLWKYKSENSEAWVKSLILVNGGYALRDKSTNELLSFAIINDHLAIGLLTTVEKAQRKGYAEIIAKYVSLKMAQEGLTPTVYVSNENPLGFGLFQKLGFRRISGSNWIVVVAQSNN